MDLETFTAAIALRDFSGKPFGQLFREALGLAKQNNETVYAQGFDDGLQEGQIEAERRGHAEGRRSAGIVDVRCCYCQDAVVARCEDDVQSAINGAAYEVGWLHYDCVGSLVSSEWGWSITKPDGTVVTRMPGQSGFTIQRTDSSDFPGKDASTSSDRKSRP